jgi:hypothetical protein
MDEIKIITLTEQELEEKLQRTVAKALEPIVQMLKPTTIDEVPKCRKELMREFGITDVRTFNKWVDDRGIKQVGLIGKQPLYLKSHFIKAA